MFADVISFIIPIRDNTPININGGLTKFSNGNLEILKTLFLLSIFKRTITNGITIAWNGSLNTFM